MHTTTATTPICDTAADTAIAPLQGRARLRDDAGITGAVIVEWDDGLGRAWILGCPPPP